MKTSISFTHDGNIYNAECSKELSIGKTGVIDPRSALYINRL
jgi:hypothetical protein